jgi:hypothetical protein
MDDDDTIKNLLAETLIEIHENGLTVEDVQWVGRNGRWISWQEFTALADVIYDSGYGSAHVPEDLQVVGVDWWLERYEYDGSKCWEFKRLPKRPPDHVAFTVCETSD